MKRIIWNVPFLAFSLLCSGCADSGSSQGEARATASHEQSITIPSGETVALEQFVEDVGYMGYTDFALKYGSQAAEKRALSRGMPGADPMGDALKQRTVSQQEKLELARFILEDETQPVDLNETLQKNLSLTNKVIDATRDALSPMDYNAPNDGDDAKLEQSFEPSQSTQSGEEAL